LRRVPSPLPQAHRSLRRRFHRRRRHQRVILADRQYDERAVRLGYPHRFALTAVDVVRAAVIEKVRELVKFARAHGYATDELVEMIADVI
jgi:hypothetical protein